jgi:hypothetical protein
MSRRLTAILVSSAIALGSINTSAWSAPAWTQHIEAAAVQTAPPETKNVPPLAPAGAAGIREAQGAAGNEGWIIAGFIAVFALFWILDSDGDDDDDVPSGTGTN